MKHIFLFLTAVMLLCTSCRWMGYKKIKGNGVITIQDRNITRAEKITLKGSYDVEIAQGPVTSVKIEGDENILPFIFINEEEGSLTIRSKPHVRLSTEHGIKIYITTNNLQRLQISGSGNVTGKNKFTAVDKLVLRISGSGNMKMEVNAPRVEAEITGSGSILLNGETKDQHIRIAGSGDYLAEDLKSENATVRIAGNGDVKVFADARLDINIAGSGSIFYKGNPAIKQNVLGSGEVKKIE
jgi:hypothetical protein